MTMTTFRLPPQDTFAEVPGMRGLRVARIGQADGKILEVIEGVQGVVIPLMTSPSAERGRVLEGKIQFMQEGEGRVLSVGETWEVPAGAPQGPHIFLEASRVAILRDGPGAFDPQ